MKRRYILLMHLALARALAQAALADGQAAAGGEQRVREDVRARVDGGGAVDGTVEGGGGR